MRVLLVYANQARDLLPAPPIGLAYVASAARKAGHDVRVLDLHAHRRPLTTLADVLRELAPEVVGISVRNIDNVVLQRPVWHLGELPRLLAVVRRESRAPIVLGGPAVSILGGAVLDHLDADFAVVGEGEASFPRLLAELAGARRYGRVPGLWYRAGATVTGTASAALPSFGASGMEHWIDWRPYERHGGTWAIQTKRGCPLGCTYCVYPAIEGRACRLRAVEEVVDEIEHVMAYVGPRTFEIVDSTFNVPAAHAEAICRAIIHRRLAVKLTVMGVNPLGASAELFALMREAGVISMMISPEAASDVMLRNLRKGFGVERVHETARLARASGIASAWLFMLGGPGETRDTVEETVSFVERHLNWRGCLTIFMTGIRVLPGTDLARAAVQEGFFPPDRDLAAPTFYFSPHVDERWVLARINRAIARCPAIVHAAEEGQSKCEHAVDRMLGALRIAPPYWRFLPLLLRVPPLPALRRRLAVTASSPYVPA